jgi:hypothetical protein
VNRPAHPPYLADGTAGAAQTLFPGFQGWRLLTVPRPPEDVQSAAWMAASVKGAATAAHACLRGSAESHPALLSAWLRLPGADSMQFLLAGRPFFPAAREVGLDGGPVPVLYPPGASAQPAELGDILGQFAAWARCLGSLALPDPVPATPQAGRPKDGGAGFDDYVVHLTHPFAWLVVAEPVMPKVLDDEAAMVSAELTLLRKRENSELHRADLERGQQRYRELVRARSSGLWRVHVLAGGLTDADAQAAAMTLAAACNCDDLPWVLSAAGDPGPLDTIMGIQAEGADSAQSPFLAGTETVAILTRPPARELPGVRLVSRCDFDVTPEAASGPAVTVLGQVLDEGLGPSGAFAVSRDTLNRHGFICGATGSGKSQTARRLLESLATAADPVPWLVIEPVKAEYASMQGRLGADRPVLILRPGDLASPPASLNPLEPEPGFPLQSHADLIRALFLAAFEADEPFPQILAQALGECYAGTGWDLVSGELRPRCKPKFLDSDPDRAARHRYPTLGELQSAARTVVDNIGYGKEIAADVRGFVDVRIGSLRSGTPGRFFEGGHPIDIGQLLQRNAVLELEPITSDQDKAFLIGAVLIRIVEYLRIHGPAGPGGLAHVLLIEEAHRLLKNVEKGPAAAAVELFASLLAEIRAYGEGVIVVEQIPSKISSDVIKNTALKVMHRLPAADDREAVGATMNLSEQQSETVVSLRPGLAAVTVDGTDRPLLVQVAAGIDRESAEGCTRTPPLTSRRSVNCGDACLAAACTLRQINDASAIARAPAITVWTEAVAAAILLGIAAPAPRQHVRDMWPADGRDLDCALAAGADLAVDARRALLRRWIDADDFGLRLAASLRSLLAGQAYECPDPERWQAGFYRHIRERVAIEQMAADLTENELAQAPGHPASGEWRRQGLILESTTLAGQLAEIRQHPSFAPGSKRVIFGDPRNSGLESALASLAGGVSAASMERALRYTCCGPGLEVLITLLPEIAEEIWPQRAHRETNRT